MREPIVLMVGTSLDSPGGMTSVVCSYRDAGFFDTWNVNYLPTYRGPGFRQQMCVYPKALAYLAFSMSLGKVALLHVHSASRGSFWRKSIACLIARVFDVPYLFHIHSGEFPVFYESEVGKIGRAWIRATLRKAACVIALTPTWRSALMAIEPTASVVTIPNPTRVPDSVDVSGRVGRTVLFLGRLREKKGVFDLIRAVPSVRARFPDARFVLAGDGDVDAVQDLAGELNVRDAIETPGWLDGPEKERALSQADVLVLPSYFEGMPICILEAMAAGVPVVATRVGGIPDIVTDGETGLLVMPGEVDELVSAISRIFESPDLRRALCIHAFEFSRSGFSTEAVCSQLGAVYETYSCANQRDR